MRWKLLLLLTWLVVGDGGCPKGVSIRHAPVWRFAPWEGVCFSVPFLPGTDFAPPWREGERPG